MRTTFHDALPYLARAQALVASIGSLFLSEVLGVDATPTFFVNGTKFVGVPRYEEFKRLIDDAIDAAS